MEMFSNYVENAALAAKLLTDDLSRCLETIRNQPTPQGGRTIESSATEMLLADIRADVARVASRLALIQP